MAYIVRISRDARIEESRKDGLIFLNTKAKHLTGQQWQVRYYRDSDRTEIDTIVAIGVKNGTGSDCYRVISYGVESSIVAITNTLPDVSDLIHGEVYIVNLEGLWYYVTETDDTRRLDLITGGPYVYHNLEDGMIWYYTDGKMRREDDFYTREEINRLINSSAEGIEHIRQILAQHQLLLEQHAEAIQDQREKNQQQDEIIAVLDNAVFPLTVGVSATPSATTWASGTTHDVKFTFSATKIQPDGQTRKDVIGECKCYYRVGSSGTFNEVANPFTYNGVTGENTTVTFQFKVGADKFGGLKDTSSISYRFGYRYLYGVTSATAMVTDISGLSQSGITTKSTYYTAAYTTNLTNLATFAIPVNWGTISKITDSSGVTEYTTSFQRVAGTFVRNVDGLNVTYYVYRWSSNPTIATNFTYRFYN